MTKVINKHMVPILNRPMITFPVATLRTLGAKEILIVSGGEHIGAIAEFLGDGSDYGVSLTYRVQRNAGGIAEALGLAKEFAKGEPVAVVLGDNIFDNDQFAPLNEMPVKNGYAAVWTTSSMTPERFGVITTDKKGVQKIKEKPKATKKPKAKDIVVGLYLYPSDVFDVVKTLKPSARGELEITDVNNHYLKTEKMIVHGVRGFWSDAGTPETLYDVIKWAHDRRKQ